MKRALLIGINYIGQSAELSGCINDIIDMKNLCLSQGYEEIIMIHDSRKIIVEADSVTKSVIPFTQYPKKKNIIAALKWMFSQLKTDDTLLIHYSGHGTQSIAWSELDGKNEAIVPVDYAYEGIILDNELKNIIVTQNTDMTVKIRCILDCCHSGTGLDLKYNLRLPRLRDSTDDAILNISKMVKEQVVRELNKYFDSDIVDKYMSDKLESEMKLNEIVEWENNGQEKIVTINNINKRVVQLPKFDIIMLSGCDDHQTSADATFDNRANGALTKMFIDLFRSYQSGSMSNSPVVPNVVLNSSNIPNVAVFLNELRRIMKLNMFTQIPQLSSESIFTPFVKFDL